MYSYLRTGPTTNIDNHCGEIEKEKQRGWEPNGKGEGAKEGKNDPEEREESGEKISGHAHSTC